MKFIILLLFSFTIVHSQKIPSYIKKCNLGDKKVNVCLQDSLNGLIKDITKGYEPLGVPNLNPMKLERIILNFDSNLNFIMNNVEVHGFDNFKAESFLFYSNPPSSGLVLSNPNITIIGDYYINGIILDQYIYGKGRGNISLEDGIYTWYPNMHLRTTNDAQYWVLGDFQRFSFRNKIVHYNLENLFNGDKQQGKEVNEFLNNNWALITDVLRNGFNKIFSEIITYISNKFAQLPISELFEQEQN